METVDTVWQRCGSDTAVMADYVPAIGGTQDRPTGLVSDGVTQTVYDFKYMFHREHQEAE